MTLQDGIDVLRGIMEAAPPEGLGREGGRGLDEEARIGVSIGMGAGLLPRGNVRMVREGMGEEGEGEGEGVEAEVA